jgi:hypothetical protein
LLCHRSFEQCLQLLPHTSFLGGCGSGQPRSSMAAVAKFWDARRRSGSASAPAFAPPLARRLLLGSGARAGGVCA